MEEWGFKFWGKKENGERVNVRDFSAVVNKENPRQSYPYIIADQSIFLVPIYPDYHTELLPDSILRTESPDDFIEDYPHRNAINKVYVSRAFEPFPVAGDIIVFYRTGGIYKSVVTTIGCVEEVIHRFKNVDDFVNQCRKRTVYSEPELRKMWDYNPRKQPFLVRFLYEYSFPNRINMKQLIDLGIIAGVDDAPRGFKPISKEQFLTILKETRSDARFIIN
jgi:hypothetical protein